MPGYTFSPVEESDRTGVVDLFNYYIEHTDAAFPETAVPYEFFDMLMQIAHGYPTVAVRKQEATLVGFGMLRPHNPMPAFARTAEITYFIRSGETGKGVGTRMLQYLETEGKKLGIAVILAHISSRNEGSIRFHHKHGFFECGRFRNTGMKRGVLFDTVWMEKEI